METDEAKIIGIRKELESIGQRLDAADRRGAHYAEVYGLVVRENQCREELQRLEAKETQDATR